MLLTVVPLEFTNINNYSVTERLVIIQGNSGTFYVQLRDTSGQRYLPLLGSTIQIVFPRALSIAAVPVNQDVTVTLIPVDSRDTSVLKFDLTAANTDKIVSEGVKLIVTEAGIAKTYPVDHFVRKRSNAPGA
jgi:hypothetical protein